MGVFNAEHEKSFYKSINSILNQTYSEFEFIICDDGSNDNTYPMLEAVAKNDNRIILIRNQSNCGLAYTLNQCISKAQGEFIIRQDIDDYSEINRISVLIAELETKPYLDIIGSNISLYDDNGVWGKLEFPVSPVNKDFLFGVPFRHGAVAIRKACLIRIGCYTVSKQTRRTEDYELFMRIYADGFKGENVQQILYHYKEDISAQRKRLYRYRIDEACIRARGFKALGLMPKGIIYVIKPLIVGLIPLKMLDSIKNNYYNRLK